LYSSAELFNQAFALIDAVGRDGRAKRSAPCGDFQSIMQATQKIASSWLFHARSAYLSLNVVR
jgi:hypothetical protein